MRRPAAHVYRGRLLARGRRHAVTPDQAAESILEGVRKGRYIVYTSPDIRLAFAAQKFAPPLYGLAMRAIGRKINKAGQGILP